MYKVFLKASLEAGDAIMTVFRTNFEVTYKNDASPVTVADKNAEKIILDHLGSVYPHIPIIAEESVAAGYIPDVTGGTFFLVDPLDGTKEFVNKREEFTVNIALIKGGIPVEGIIYAPAKGVAYRTREGVAEQLNLADHKILGSREIKSRVRGTQLAAVTSRSYNNSKTVAFIKNNGITKTTAVGSSLKFCVIAEGLADVYPRFGRTMEWDTAAGDAILRASGGVTVSVDNTPLAYGKTNQSSDSDFANPFFIAWGKQ